MTPTTTCPMFDTPNCRFFSFETQVVTYSPLIEDPKSKRLIAGSMLHKKVVSGTGCFCNNASMWVDRLKYCPARWGLYRHHTGKKADGAGTYPDSQTIVAPSILFR